ncbi:uncharacterized protein LOC114744413 [Neltuma alba]|uniref:uncharacterized protein LOC114744413 n=1 Tax=Neltuma alba TaxID=207710 RepID=UPI0010A56E93|nr:uncharacterized protein LOC114744413 [Prosopis alba]
MGLDGNDDWNLVWGFAIGKLWLWRNEATLDANFAKPPDATAVINHSWQNFTAVTEPVKHAVKESTVCSISWSPPPEGWFKLNVDGAVSKSSKKAGCGGVLEAEASAICKGLKLALDFRFKKVILESDAKALIDYLAENNPSYCCSLLLMQIHNLLKYNWEIKLCFIGRQANEVADALAIQGISCPDAGAGKTTMRTLAGSLPTPPPPPNGSVHI